MGPALTTSLPAATATVLPAAALAHLKPSNALGLLFVGCALGLTAAGLCLSALHDGFLWLLGQTLLAFALVQWFVLLHEAGHQTLFRSTWLNRWTGHLAGCCALIPFVSWKRVHGLHHRWTGWQDLDPTTVVLVPRPLALLERLVVNACWLLGIPLFSVLYRLNNFWNLPRLFRRFPHRRQRWSLALNVVLLLAVYGLTAYLAGAPLLLRCVGLALLLSLALQDPLILSQHTHIPLQLSHGQDVRPFPPLGQEVFTRSLRLPAWCSTLLLHLDAHELHHMYPAVPGYRLRAVPYEPRNEVVWWRWLLRAKRVPGTVFLFQNRNDSGFDV